MKWQIEDWSRTTSRPFEFFLDVGPVPQEKTVVALALDRDRRPLYRVETLLNAGGRRLTLQFLSPLDGQRVSGPVTALVRAVAPRGGLAGFGHARRGWTRHPAGRRRRRPERAA